MGMPAEGMASFYRNSKSDVLKYFGKFHNGKVKIFNLCDDKFIDTSKTSYPIDKNLLNMAGCNFGITSVPVAYFPMMDHNPGPLKMIFYLCLDALLFLSQDPENVVSIHCKAGKGRTGLVIASYMLFMEGCTDAH
jgi:phosphatidylinositol-3,4,5-trisphosphate 3-phosphatase/dual-specificity protein phosphatase PTEN